MPSVLVRLWARPLVIEPAPPKESVSDLKYEYFSAILDDCPSVSVSDRARPLVSEAASETDPVTVLNSDRC